jgi:hypothetical protein
MQVMEFSKGSGSAIAISLAHPSPHAFAEEFRQIQQALLAWRAKHGRHCEMVMFSIVSGPEHYAAIESLLEQVYDNEAELSPLLHSVQVKVALLNSRGKPVKKYSLGNARQEVKSKPWWRFW